MIFIVGFRQFIIFRYCSNCNEHADKVLFSKQWLQVYMLTHTAGVQEDGRVYKKMLIVYKENKNNAN